MRVANFEFTRWIAGMFDQRNPPAIFIYRHVESNLHFAARYHHSARYTGPEHYPNSLIAMLRKQPSDVEVFVAPMRMSNRATAERKFNAVVDELMNLGMYRKPNRPSGSNALPDLKYNVFRMVHKPTGAVYFGSASSDVVSKHYLSRKLEYFASIAGQENTRSETITHFMDNHASADPNDWGIEIVESPETMVEVYHIVEERSKNHLRSGKLVLNRVRARPSVHAYCYLHNLQPIAISKFVDSAISGTLLTKVDDPSTTGLAN